MAWHVRVLLAVVALCVVVGAAVITMAERGYARREVSELAGVNDVRDAMLQQALSRGEARGVSPASVAAHRRVDAALKRARSAAVGAVERRLVERQQHLADAWWAAAQRGGTVSAGMAASARAFLGVNERHRRAVRAEVGKRRTRATLLPATVVLVLVAGVAGVLWWGLERTARVERRRRGDQAEFSVRCRWPVPSWRPMTCSRAICVARRAPLTSRC